MEDETLSHYPTGIQQQNLESSLIEITNKKELEGLIPIQTKKFSTIFNSHADAIAYGAGIGAVCYTRKISLLSITYAYYKKKD